MRNTIDVSKLELSETIVSIRRVAKTVKGGRNMRFSVTVVVGDGEGHVGVGLGKAQEIPEAVRKATEDAKKSIIEVPTVGNDYPSQESGDFRSRQSAADAGYAGYRSNRRFIGAYCSGSRRDQGYQSQVHRFQ